MDLCWGGKEPRTTITALKKDSHWSLFGVTVEKEVDLCHLQAHPSVLSICLSILQERCTLLWCLIVKRFYEVSSGLTPFGIDFEVVLSLGQEHQGSPALTGACATQSKPGLPVNWILQCAGKESQRAEFCSFAPCREMTFVLHSTFPWEDQLLAYVTSSLPFLSDLFLQANMDPFHYSVIQISLLLIAGVCGAREDRNCSWVWVKIHLVLFLVQWCKVWSVCMSTHMVIGIKGFSSPWYSLADPNSLQASATGTDLQSLSG